MTDPGLPGFVRVSGTSRLGNLIEWTTGPLMPPGVAAPPPEIEAPPTVEEKPVLTAPIEEVAEQEPIELTPQPAEEGSWLMPAIVFGAINLILLVGVAVWFLLRRRRGNGSDELELDQLIEMQVAVPGDDAEQAREDAA
jgi:hypothetical protein